MIDVRLQVLVKQMIYYCNGFHENLNPCLNEVLEPRGLCVDHTNYYTSDTEFLNKIYYNGFYLSSREKTMNVFKKAILEGFIRVTQKHLMNLLYISRPLEDLLDYYLICCMQPGVDPLWSTTFFKKIVLEIVSCHSNMTYFLLEENPSKLYSLLNPFFNNTSRSFDSILYNLLYYVSQLEITEPLRFKKVDNISNPKVSLLQYILDHPRFRDEFSWTHSIYSEKFISLISSSNHSIDGLTSKILEFLVRLDEKRKAIRESRKDMFKEKRDEILSIAWAPERFCDWCLTPDQGEALRSRWSC